MKPGGNPHRPRGKEERSYTTPQEAKEEELVEPYSPLLPGVWYSSVPIIAACLQVRAGCLQVRAGCLKVSLHVALRSVWVASWSHRELPRGPCSLPRGPIMGCL